MNLNDTIQELAEKISEARTCAAESVADETNDFDGDDYDVRDDGRRLYVCLTEHQDGGDVLFSTRYGWDVSDMEAAERIIAGIEDLQEIRDDMADDLGD